MKAKWFLFEHAIGVFGKSSPRPFIAAHLVATPVPFPSVLPICETLAKHIPDAAASAGFIVTCAACLAQSEILL